MINHYANLHLVSWVTMFFGCSMPILYPIALFYFASTFFLEKFMIFNFYRKSDKFNGQLPLDSLSLFKWPILFHCLFSCFVFSNNQIFYNSTTRLEDLGITKLKEDIFKFTDSPDRTHLFMQFQSQTAETIIGHLYASSSNFLDRLFHILILLILWLVLWVVYVFFTPISACFHRAYTSCNRKVVEDETEDSEELEIEVEGVVRDVTSAQDCKRCQERVRQRHERHKEQRALQMAQ